VFHINYLGLRLWPRVFQKYEPGKEDQEPVFQRLKDYWNSKNIYEFHISWSYPWGTKFYVKNFSHVRTLLRPVLLIGSSSPFRNSSLIEKVVKEDNYWKTIAERIEDEI
jgi:hypothetical protein